MHTRWKMEDLLWLQFSVPHDPSTWFFQTFPTGVEECCIWVCDCFLCISRSPTPGQFVIRTVCVCVWSHLCWFSLSSCCLRRVGLNLLLARAASMSSISLLLNSRMAERMRRLSSRSTVPSSYVHETKRQTQERDMKMNTSIQVCKHAATVQHLVCKD